MITSTSNKQVRRIAALQKKARLRRAEGVFLAEGIKMISQANPDWIRRIYVSENFWSCSENRLFVEQLQKNHLDISVEVAADHVFEAMSDTVTPQGIMCEVSCPHYELSPLLEKAEIPRLIILENIQDPGNLGTIMRAGEAAGMDGVILSQTCVDIYNPKTVRSTMGSIYRLPFLYVDSLSQTIAWLQKRQIPVYAAAPAGVCMYDEPDYSAGCAFLVGNEANGLTEEAIRAANVTISIPMEGEIESLNAGVAASVLMYESYRQVRAYRAKCGG